MTIKRPAWPVAKSSVRGTLWVVLILVVVGGTGCLAGALAPLALQAGEMAGVGALNAAGYAMAGHAHDENQITDTPQWQALAGEQSDAAGWRQLSNLRTMSFEPPLQQSLRDGKPNFLAYAPAEPRTASERDQLVALTADFGAGLGTFQWNGRAYAYTLVHRLPCFPGPVVIAGQTSG